MKQLMPEWGGHGELYGQLESLSMCTVHRACSRPPGSLWSLHHMFKIITLLLLTIVLAPIAANALPSVGELSAPDSAV